MIIDCVSGKEPTGLEDAPNEGAMRLRQGHSTAFSCVIGSSPLIGGVHIRSVTSGTMASAPSEVFSLCFRSVNVLPTLRG